MNGSNGFPCSARYRARPARREDPVGGERGAAVGVAVADVDDLAGREQGALARLAADVAVVGIAPLDAPAVGPRIDAVRVQLDLRRLPLEDGLDQLVEPARDDVDLPAVGLRGVRRTRRTPAGPRLVEHPGDDLVERRGDRLELARDHLAQRQAALVEAVLDLLVDGRVAELERDPVEEIRLGDRAVEVEDDRPALWAAAFRIRVRHVIMFPEPTPLRCPDGCPESHCGSCVMRIACVGGGPAGLYLAILMKARDPEHDLTVFERNPPGVTHGWGVVFWDDLVEQLEASDPATASEIRESSFRWNGQLLAVEDKSRCT